VVEEEEEDDDAGGEVGGFRFNAGSQARRRRRRTIPSGLVGNFRNTGSLLKDVQAALDDRIAHTSRIKVKK